ncbi:MAG: hypothetical protein R3E10_17225 [Gemmatimonadota bacterium]
MEPLTHEWIAELVDREPTTQERELLDANPFWAAELEAMRAQTRDLAGLPRMVPPRGDWEHLEARLLSEGLITPAGAGWIRVPTFGTAWTRLAAAVVLFLGGSLTGATLARSGPASGPPRAFDVAGVASLDEAADLVERTEQQYVSSLHRYRQLAERAGRDPGASLDPSRRAEALDLLVQASRNALRTAPYDPFINGILVNALAEQQAVVRQTGRGTDDNWF